MTSRLKQYGPLLVSLIVLWMVLILLLNASLSLTGGHLAYALDDAYIHTAMAKNISQHGVWGVSSHEFSSTSGNIIPDTALAAVVSANIPMTTSAIFSNLCVIFCIE